MPYVLPTATQVKARVADLEDEDDGKINFAIIDAARNVDSSWIEDDYQTAIIFLAAHFLLSGDASVGGGSSIKSENFGRMSVTYGNTADKSGYSSTEWGQRYLELLRKNHPPIMVL
jgi:hypothetical protein